MKKLKVLNYAFVNYSMPKAQGGLTPSQKIYADPSQWQRPRCVLAFKNVIVLHGAKNIIPQ